MPSFCVKCGAAFAEGQSFCSSCGARRSEPVSAEPAKRFCTGCGTLLTGNAAFCTKCGTRFAPAASQPAPSTPTIAPQSAPLVTAQAFASSSQAAAVQPAPIQVAPSPSAPAAQPKKTGFVFKLIVAVVILFVLGGIAIGAGLIYVGYVAKKRVSAVQKAYQNNDLVGMIAAAKGVENKPQPLPNWKPAPADLAASPASKIPLRKSLRTINTGSDSLRGDFESIYIVDSVTDESVHIKASQQFPNGDALDRLVGNKTDDKEKARTIKCGRTVFRADLQSAVETDGYFCREGQDEKHPGTTAMGISRKEFDALKATGQVEVIFHEDPLRAVLKSFKNAMNAQDGKAGEAASQDLLNKMMNLAPTGVMTPKQMDTPPIKYTIYRQGNSDLAFPVLVNDQPVELPVMDILCKHPDGVEGHIYVLDDPDNPLFLAAASESLGREQVTKIYWDQEIKNELADQLEKTGRAKVYDLYFDFRSDQLRPESDKVLKEIAQVMHDHPDWKLSVEGNTDNIGGDSYNLDLSKRRAAAVKEALVSKYDIAPDRLSSTGFGRSHPIDTNDTIEGRARNRRVELAKQ